jgi:hypothetical protein
MLKAFAVSSATLASDSLYAMLKTLMLTKFGGAEAYGWGEYLKAVLAWHGFLFGVVEQTTRRYLQEFDSPAMTKAYLILNFSFKTIVWTLATAIGLWWLDEKYSAPLLLLVVVRSLAIVLNGEVVCLLQAQQKYRLLVMVGSRANVASLILLAILHFGFKFNGVELILWFLGSETLIYIIKTVVMALPLQRELLSPVWSAKTSREDYHQVIRRTRNYSSPLAITGVVSFMLKNLPVVLLGREGNFVAVSGWELTRKIYDYIHRFVPNVLKSITSSMRLEINDQGVSRDATQFNSYYLLVMALVSTTLLIALPYTYQLIGFSFDHGLDWVLVLMGIRLVVGAWSHALYWVVSCSHSNWPLGLTSAMGGLSGGLIMIIAGNSFDLTSASYQQIGVVGSGVAIYSFWIMRRLPQARSYVLRMSLMGLVSLAAFTAIGVWHV